jgi:nucleoside-diphosphate-sugar epimerase
MTGGSGFIGTRLIEELNAAGHEVVIIDIAHDADPTNILNQDKLNAMCTGCDAIYHLAAAHRDDIFPVDEYYEVNGVGTQNVTKAAQVNNIKKIIFTSTVAVYAMNSNNADETNAPQPFNDYGKSKLEAEQHLKNWANESPDNCASIVRPVVVFGENNRGNVYNLIKQITGGKFLMIGAGQNKKSMAYVGNIAAFLQARLGSVENFEIFNYADKPDFATKDLIETIYEKLGRETPKLALPYGLGMMAGYIFDMLSRITRKTFSISSIRIQKFCADTTINADKAHATGFKSKFTLADGVERMVQHDFKEHIK